MFISGTRICLKPFNRTDIFLGIGQMLRTWTWATSCPLASARRTAWWIGPKVEPQPTTASSAPSRPRQTSWSGMELAMPSTLEGGGAAWLERAVEGVGGRAHGNDRRRRIRVAAVDRLVEVGLLGLGR